MRNDFSRRNFFYAISLGLCLGFFIAIPLLVFMVAGIFLDKKFNTTPRFLLLFTTLSLAAVFYETHHLLLPFLNKKVKTKK